MPGRQLIRTKHEKIALAAAAVAGVALGAGCGSSASTAASSTTASTAAAAAPASPAPAPQQTDPSGQACPSLDSAGYCPGDDPTTSAPAVTPAQAAMNTWCAGNGYSDLQTVRSDLSQIGTDSGDSDLIAVEQDGAQLFSDARTAGANLPPKSDPHSFGYGVYTGYLLIAGYRASTGNISGAGSASPALQEAQPFLPDLQAINTACGGTS
jgi:hypothetical protein